MPVRRGGHSIPTVIPFAAPVAPPLGSRLFTWIFLLLAAITTVSASARTASTSSSRPPNIVFVLADDLGVFDLGCYGRTEHRTPHLDQLAADGTRFTSAYCAQPICSPSRAAILTGQSPARLHLTTFLPGRKDAASQQVLHPQMFQQLPLEQRTLAEELHDAGYATACIGKWHLGGAGFGPESQGFDVAYAGNANTSPTPEEGSKGESDLTRHAEAFITENRDRPFFLYLAHNSPHIPYQARPDHAAAHASAFEPAYAAVIESLDESIGRLLRHLDSLGLRHQTLVVFTSDNGGLHVPELRHPRVTHNGPFRAGKGYLYEGGLRVPLIARWPGRVPARRVVDTPVINTDWFPTLLELCRVRPRNPRPLDGQSFAARLIGRGPAPRREFCWHFPHYTNQGGRPGGAVRDGRWKYIEFYDTGGQELYDLESDPGENRSLAEAERERVRRLASVLAEYRRTTGAQVNAPNPRFDPVAYRNLYLDFDPSRFAPLTATETDWQRIARWRQDMDAATR